MKRGAKLPFSCIFPKRHFLRAIPRKSNNLKRQGQKEAGAGLSASAGFAYDGERFERCFSDFHKKYGITDMTAPSACRIAICRSF